MNMENFKDNTKEELISEIKALHSQINHIEKNEDISEINKIEEKLKSSNDHEKELNKNISQLNAIINALPGMVTITDTELNVIVANDEVYQKFGQNGLDEVIGQKCYKTRKGLKKPCPQCGLVEAFKTGNSVVRYSTSDEEELLGISTKAYSVPLKNEKGEIWGGVEVIMDISDFRKADKAFQESENSLRTLFNAMTDIVMEIDRDGKYINIAPTSTEHLFKPSQEIIGKTFHEIFPKAEADKFLEFVRNCIDNNKIKTIEYQLVFGDETKWFEGRGIPKTDNTILYIARDITERKIAEKAIKISEEKYKTLFESNVAGVIISSLSGTIIATNTAFEEFMEYSQNELSGINVSKIYAKADDRKRFLNTLQQEGKVDDFELQLISKNGKNLWSSLSSKLIKYDEKDAILSTSIDISKRKDAEIKLLKSEKKYRDLFEKSDDAILILHNNIFVDCNLATIKMLRYYSKENFLNTHPSELSPEKQPDGRKSFSKANEMIKMAIKNGSHRFEWYHKRSNGEVFPVEVVLTAISTEKNNQIIHTVWRDITERVNAKKALIESERSFKLFMNSSSDLFFLKDLSFRYIISNHANSKFLGAEEADIVGKTDFDLMPFDNASHCRQTDMQAIEQKTTIINIEKIDNKIYETRKIPVFVDNKIIAIAGIIRDITAAKQVEIDLQRAKEKAEESERLKTAFLANMSHEIRTPMNGILGFSDLLKEPLLSAEELHQYIEIIERSGHRMLNIINDLIDISKVEAGQMETKITDVNINEQIEYLFVFFKPEAEKKGLKLSFKNSLLIQDSIIKSDKEKIYAILTNLIKNSIKYSNSGKIEFGYKLISTGSTRELEFFIKDNGIGIPKNRQAAIFNRFIQADIDDKDAREGAGLGLSISKAYVEMLGGKIWVESEVGLGSTFYFTIPYNNEKAVNIEDNTNKTEFISKQIKKKLKILLAEDEKSAKLHLSIILRNMSKEILHSRNGIETIELSKNNPDIDIILMDIKMPKMDGYEATRQIRKFNNNVKIIAQTAYALKGDKEKAINAGCDDYISKPINKEELLEKIGKLVKK